MDNFLIEGDSLLAELFSDPNLDWNHGGQYLHLFYLLERFLTSLTERGCVSFQLVFFRDHKKMWRKRKAVVAAGEGGKDDENEGVEDNSRLLAREMIIAHLKNNTPYEVLDQFDNWLSGK